MDSNTLSHDLSMWHKILDGFVINERRRKNYSFLIANFQALSDGLRVGFLNDRYPFLSLTESKTLLIKLKESGLVKSNIHVLSIGEQEIVFINVDGLLHFVSSQSFRLLALSSSVPEFMSPACDVAVKLVSLVTDSIKHYKASSKELVLYPTQDISGSTLLGVCLGYPVVYIFETDSSLGSFVQYKLYAKFKSLRHSMIYLFSFSVPDSVNFAPQIESWYQDLLLRLPSFTLIDNIELRQEKKSSSNIVF